MEFARRFLLILCTFAAIVLLFAQTPVLFLLEQPDFEQNLRITAFSWKYKGMSVDDFMQEKTKGLVRTLDDKHWQEIKAFVQAHPNVYVKDNAAVLGDIVKELTPHTREYYLRGQDTPAGDFVHVSRLTPANYFYAHAPYWLRHPCTLCSPLLLVLGVVFYVFLPRREFTQDVMSYSEGFAAVYGVDLVGWMISSGFFTVGLGVGLSGTEGGVLALFSSNLIFISGVLWLFCLFGFYMFKIAATYAGTGLQCKDGQLIQYAPTGTKVAAIKDVVSVRLGRWKASKWVTRLGFLLSLFNWRALGPTLLNSSRSDPQLEIQLKDGKTWIFTLTGAKNVEPVLTCLEKQGVSIPKGLKKFT